MADKAEKDWRVTDVENLKKNFERWRKIFLQGIPIGLLVVILSLVIPGIPFFWRFMALILGFTPLAAFYITHSLKVVRAWESGVVFHKAQVDHEVDPGWRFLKWPLESIEFVKMYDVKYDPPDQEVFTREDIDGEDKQMPAMADIVFWGKVTNPTDFITKAENVKESVLKFVLGILRSVCSEKSFEVISKTKDVLAEEVERRANGKLFDWGYKILKLQIQSIKPSPELLKAQEQIQVSSKKRESALIEAGTRAQIMAILDKADPDMRRRGLQALEGFKGSINIFGSSIEEILKNITGGAKR